MPKRKKEEDREEEPARPAAKSKRNAPPPPPFVDPPVRLETPEGKPFTLRICSWNVDGLRAWVRKGGLQWVKQEAPDILCLQETKCGAQAVPPELRELPGLPHQYWASPTDRPGYSGVGLLAKEEPLRVTPGIGVEEHDQEGRVLTAEYPSLFVVAVYVPNSGRGLVRLDYRQRWDVAFQEYLEQLQRQKPVAVCGDLNVAHQELDLRNPGSNQRTAGFTRQERDSFSRLLARGFLDTFRHLNPGLPSAFTFWSYLGGARARNVGWRLDYCLWPRTAQGALCDSRIHPQVMGSDHCPVSLYLAL